MLLTIQNSLHPFLQDLPNKIERALENRYVQVAIVVGLIALSCIVFPAIATFINGVVVGAFTLLNKPIVSLLSLLNGFLPTIPPFVQIALSIGTLAIGCFSFAPLMSGYLFYQGCQESIVSWALPWVLSLVALPFENSALSKNSTSSSKNSLLYPMLIAPIVEEIFFRALIPFLFRSTVKAFFFVASTITAKDYTTTMEKVITKTENIFNSWIFGMAHFTNNRPDRFEQALQNGALSTLTLFPAYKAQGLTGSITAHMSHNIFKIGSSYLLNKIWRWLFPCKEN